MGGEDKPTVENRRIRRSKLSDVSYFTDDGSCGNRTYSTDLDKNPSWSNGKVYLLPLG